MYDCKYSEARHTNSLGEIAVCNLNHRRCEYDGDGEGKCKDFIMKIIINGFDFSEADFDGLSNVITESIRMCSFESLY